MSAFVVAKEVVTERNAYGTLYQVQHFPVVVRNGDLHHLTANDFNEPVGFASFQEADRVVRAYSSPDEEDVVVVWDYQGGCFISQSEPDLAVDPDAYYESYREDFHSDG